jgi:hypothetical protein
MYYICKTKRDMEEVKLYDWIVKELPDGGYWNKDENALVFLKFSKTMLEKGIEFSVIKHFLSNLYNAVKDEQTLTT